MARPGFRTHTGPLRPGARPSPAKERPRGEAASLVGEWPRRSFRLSSLGLAGPSQSRIPAKGYFLQGTSSLRGNPGKTQGPPGRLATPRGPREERGRPAGLAGAPGSSRPLEELGCQQRLPAVSPGSQTQRGGRHALGEATGETRRRGPLRLGDSERSRALKSFVLRGTLPLPSVGRKAWGGVLPAVRRDPLARRCRSSRFSSRAQQHLKD